MVKHFDIDSKDSACLIVWEIREHIENTLDLIAANTNAMGVINQVSRKFKTSEFVKMLALYVGIDRGCDCLKLFRELHAETIEIYEFYRKQIN